MRIVLELQNDTIYCVHFSRSCYSDSVLGISCELRGYTKQNAESYVKYLVNKVN